MKKVLTIAAALFIMAGSAFAQTAQTPLPQVRAKGMTADMTNLVTLTGDQQSQVYNIYTDYFKATDEAEALRATDAKAADAKVATAKTARDKALKATLTADQLKSWSADKKSGL